MTSEERFKANLYKVNEASFEDRALNVFKYQYLYNNVYQKYVDLLNIKPSQVKSLNQIPFLPIQLFKSHVIKTGEWQEETVFESSGTTGVEHSKHYVKSVEFYLQNAKGIFEADYGALENYTFLGLLPSYLERSTSSLVHMVDYFIKSSRSTHSGFYLNQWDLLSEKLRFLKKKRIPTIIIGVTFALIELAERFKEDLSGIIFMETGGMKGRREELTREEVHKLLMESFSIKSVHSEYGMTELLSQAYSKKDGIFEIPGQMKVLIRDVNDPFDLEPKRRAGGINIIDLANVDSCSFIETQDVGELVQHKRLKVLGRLDLSELRGCNLLIQ